MKKVIESLKQTGLIIYRAIDNTVVKHDGIEHAGYLSFLTLLALFPFLVFLIALAGFIGDGELGREFVLFLRNNLPNDVTEALIPRLDEIAMGPPPGLLTLSMLAAIWTASSAVEGYRTVLNRAYHVGTPPAYLWRRLLSILQLLLFSFLIIFGMIVLVVAPLVLRQLEAVIGLEITLDKHIQWNNWVQIFSLIILFLVVANMYYILPNIKQSLRAVVPGALFTLTCWLLTAQLFRYYLSHFDQVSLIYGSLGSIIAALLFFYLINVIFIFGAELNFQLMREQGDTIIEKEKTDKTVS